MLYMVVLGAAIFCAFQALRAKKLILSALWLAGVSALTSATLYALGAHEAAVIELSVGAGLVTVLFVFAISIAGEDAITQPPFLPRPLSVSITVGAIALLAILILPLEDLDVPLSEPSFRVLLWEERNIDLLVQIVLIFAGSLGMLGLLVEDQSRPRATVSPPPEDNTAENATAEEQQT